VKEISQAPGKTKKESKEKKVKKSATEVSKDEEAVKRLKVRLFALIMLLITHCLSVICLCMWHSQSMDQRIPESSYAITAG